MAHSPILFTLDSLPAPLIRHASQSSLIAAWAAVKRAIANAYFTLQDLWFMLRSILQLHPPFQLYIAGIFRHN